MREAQRHLCQWTLQPIAKLPVEEGSENVGVRVMINALRPVQAYDVGGRGRGQPSLTRWRGQGSGRPKRLWRAVFRAAGPLGYGGGCGGAYPSQRPVQRPAGLRPAAALLARLARGID